MTDEPDDNALYRVVMNHEEQYSIWPADRDLPLGWTDAGKTGSKADCLAHIDEVWTDMRPLSLRRHMEELARAPQPAAVEPATGEEDDLVSRLAAGPHPVEIALRPERSLARFQESVERGYVHVAFPETRGGTELGIRLDPEASDLSGADFDRGTGVARLVGSLTLNFVKVRCLAEVELPTLAGNGHLEILRD